MKKLCIFFLLLVQVAVHGQEKLIVLKNEPLGIAIGDFYISEVIDGRINKDNIGFAQVGMFNKKVDANLVGGLEPALYTWLSDGIPFRRDKTPIVLKVVYLDISERTSFTETGRAEIKVEFYLSDGGKLGKLLEAGAFVEEIAGDVTKGHERRIRNVLTQCIQEFNNSGWETMDPLMSEEEVIMAQVPVDPVPEFSRFKTERPRWNSLLTASRFYGLNAEGWAFNYYGYTEDTTSRWIAPWVLGFERFTIRPEYFRKSGYVEARQNYWMPGLSAFNKLADNIYVNFGFLFPIGSETLVSYNDGEKTNILVGLATSQGFYFIPKSKFGIVIGMGIYQRLSTSEVYGKDFGGKVEFGLKF